jgi:heme exporter protein C
MREKLIYALAIIGTFVMLFNLHTIFLDLPDEAMQGAVYRILFIHVPAVINAFIFLFVALCTSVAFLATRKFIYDSISVACIEVAAAFMLVNLVTGSIWGRNQWGIWWTWDLRLTSMLICFLLYLGYLLMRPAITEPTQRATMSAFIAIFAFADVPLVVMAIRLPNVRTQHPGPILETGNLAPAFQAPFGIGILALLLIGTALVLVRLHQETSRREIDSLRRELHAI